MYLLLHIDSFLLRDLTHNSLQRLLLIIILLHRVFTAFLLSFLLLKWIGQLFLNSILIFNYQEISITDNDMGLCNYIYKYRSKFLISVFICETYR